MGCRTPLRCDRAHGRASPVWLHGQVNVEDDVDGRLLSIRQKKKKTGDFRTARCGLFWAPGTVNHPVRQKFP